MRILLAEDDGLLAEPLREFLQGHQHVVTWVADGETALQELLGGGYDLALLDWMLPRRDGCAVVEALRAARLPLLVLMLTARDALEDVVKGLEAGADDYLVKPFRLQELLARIGSLERRAPQPWREACLQWGRLSLDRAAVLVECDGVPLTLTSKEFQLLEWFLRHPGQCFSRSRLRDLLWPLDADAGDDTVKTHLNNLRRKLRQHGLEDPIDTLHGIGYRLRPAGEGP